MPESKVRKAAAEKRKRSGSGSSTSESASVTAKGGSGQAKASSSQAMRRASRRVEETNPTKRPWLLPAAIALAVLGIAWGVLYFVDDKLIGFMEPLGSWNLAIAVAAVIVAVVGFLVLRPRTGTPYAPGSRRWVPPTFIAVGLFGVAWLIVYYVAGTDIPFMSLLGNWNILIGMAGMAASFVIATLWK